MPTADFEKPLIQNYDIDILQNNKLLVFSSSPCVNGATCRNVSSGVFSCNCARGYYGEICRYYNPCSEAPCLNGGVCVHTEHDKYTCVCERGYSRRNCDYYNACRFGSPPFSALMLWSLIVLSEIAESYTHNTLTL